MARLLAFPRTVSRLGWYVVVNALNKYFSGDFQLAYPGETQEPSQTKMWYVRIPSYFRFGELLAVIRSRESSLPSFEAGEI
jgi:hypothetical protein